MLVKKKNGGEINYVELLEMTAVERKENKKKKLMKRRVI